MPLYDLNYFNIIDPILEIENKLDVNQFIFLDYNLWPAMRTFILQEMSRQYIVDDPSVGEDHKEIPTYDSFLTKSNAEGRFKNQFPLNNNQEESFDFLFLTSPSDHTALIDGLRYQRFMDPLLEVAGQNYKCAKIELEPEYSDPAYPRYIDPYYFKFEATDSIKFFNFFKIQTEKQLKPQKENIRNFAKRICQILNNLQLDHFYEDILLWVVNCRLKTVSFRQLLSQTRPKAIFVNRFYKEFPLKLACKELGILLVDVQQDFLIRKHPYYSSWIKTPKNGYAMLPDIFWVWDDVAQNILEEWTEKSVNVHSAIVTGNSWLYRTKKGDLKEENSKYSDFLKTFENHDKNILIPLMNTYITQMIPEVVLSAAKLAPSDWRWLFRMHPSALKYIDQINDMVRDHGVKNFEVAMPSETSLLSQILKCDHIITQASTVGFDGMELGVPVTIVGETGISVYQEYIDNGNIKFAVTPDEIISNIKAISPSTQGSENDLPIGANYTNITFAFQKIYEQSKRMNN